MEPVALIMAALAAGAALPLQDTGRLAAANDAYGALLALLRRHLDRQPRGELMLHEYQQEPATWLTELGAALRATGADRDVRLLTAAQALMDLVDEAGSRAGKYSVDVHDVQGVQIGDHGTQHNTLANRGRMQAIMATNRGLMQIIMAWVATSPATEASLAERGNWMRRALAAAIVFIVASASGVATALVTGQSLWGLLVALGILVVGGPILLIAVVARQRRTRPSADVRSGHVQEVSVSHGVVIGESSSITVRQRPRSGKQRGSPESPKGLGSDERGD